MQLRIFFFTLLKVGKIPFHRGNTRRDAELAVILLTSRLNLHRTLGIILLASRHHRAVATVDIVKQPPQFTRYGLTTDKVMLRKAVLVHTHNAGWIERIFAIFVESHALRFTK